MKPIRDLRAYAEQLIASADPFKGGRIAARALSRPPLRALWLRRVVVILSSIGLFVGANVGLAFAANSSVPGDPLYGIDRAYEKIETAIGLQPNLAAERFQEAAVLSERGELALAFDTATEGLQALGTNSPAFDALTQVAHGIEETSDFPTDVQDDLNGQAQELFGIGQAVSEAATSELGDFENRSYKVLTAIRDAMIARGQELPPGLQDGTPGNSGQTPPGQDGSPGKSGEAPGNGGETPGNSQNP